MAINKNFVVKNGLEVNTQLIYADADTNNVGIASTQPRIELDVRGGIAATNTTVSGVSTVQTAFKVGSGIGGTVFIALDENLVGVGTSQPAYLFDIRSPGTGTTALYVQGDVRITGDLNLDDINLDYAEIQHMIVGAASTFSGDLDINASIDVDGKSELDELNVTGLSTFTSNIDINADVDINSSVSINAGLDVTGLSTFSSNVDINADVDINRSLIISDGLSVAGISTFTELVDVNGGIDVTGISTFTELVDVNGGIDVTGLSTFSNNLDINADVNVDRSVSITGGLNVTGISTLGRLKVFSDGTGGIVTTTSGIITYYGDGQFLQNIVSGVGIATTNPITGYSETVGLGATIITFAGPGVSTDAQHNGGTGVTVNPASGIATVYLAGGGGGGYQTTIVRDSTTVGVGGQSIFTSSSPYTSGYIDVFVNGLKLNSEDFTETDADAGTITLNSSALEGDIVELVNYEVIGITGDVETIIYKEEFVVTTESRTVFDLANTYANGYIDVYLNGVRLSSGDFTQTDSDTVTLSTPATYGDIIEVVNFKKRAISELAPIWRNDGASGGIYTFTTVGVGTSTTTAFFDVYGGMVARSGISTFENVKINGNYIDLIDDVQLRLGTNTDATLEYDTVTSSVRLFANNTDVNLFADNFNFYTSVTDNALQIVQNGAVNLYYDNSKKFETTGAGVSITGNLTSSNGINVTGIATISSNLDVNGTNHDINGSIALDHVTVSGIVTASSFVDSGTDLLTEINTKTTQGKAIAMAIVFG